MSAKSPSPPPSPRISTSRLSLYNISQAFIRARRVRRRKAIVFSSGPEPITHPALSNAVNPFKVRVSRCDEFICASGVDVKKLLRPCRRALFEQAQSIGANTLVDEQWETSIVHPKNTKDGHYKVQIRYSASASRSTKSDPDKPVALDQATAMSVPGLMTIIKRA